MSIRAIRYFAKHVRKYVPFCVGCGYGCRGGPSKRARKRFDVIRRRRTPR